MIKATLTRTESTDQGTFGELVLETGFRCFTGELPWRDNERRLSCIPPGLYTCRWRESPRFGSCYHVDGVAAPYRPGWRTEILIHAGNFVGDRKLGFRSDVEGCIVVGKKIGTLTGQRAVLDSRLALLALERALEHAPFELTIG